MSYLPHKVPPTSQLFSSFRELPSAVRMADNPAYDGERRKKERKNHQKHMDPNRYLQNPQLVVAVRKYFFGFHPVISQFQEKREVEEGPLGF